MAKQKVKKANYTKLIGSKKKIRINAFLIFIAMMIISSLMVIQLEQRSIHRYIQSEAEEVREEIEGLLADTRLAIQEARPWLGQACTSELEKKLNALPNETMHVLVVNLMRGNQVYCSSLLYNKGKKITASHLVNNEVRITKSPVLSGVPIITTVVRFEEGNILATADLRFVSSIVKSTETTGNFVLQVNDKMLTPDGVINSTLKDPHFSHYVQIEDKDAPYIIAYQRPTLQAILGSIMHSWLYGLLIISVSLIPTVLVYQHMSRRMSFYQHLSNAIHQDEISPHYQPIVCARTNQVLGAEVLARWVHEEVGFVPPDVFIPVAESSGLIVELTERLLNKVLADVKNAPETFCPNFKLNINISHTHLIDGSFYEFTNKYASRFKKLGFQLAFEITEGKDVSVNQDITSKIENIRNNGVLISLDDFGTGFSNFAWISNLNPDSIKIDRLFVNQIAQDSATPLIDCVIEMAKKMGIKTVAEGVEHDYQVSWLKANNIDFFQGYYFSKPLPFPGFVAYIKDAKKAKN